MNLIESQSSHVASDANPLLSRSFAEIIHAFHQAYTLVVLESHAHARSELGHGFVKDGAIIGQALQKDALHVALVDS